MKEGLKQFVDILKEYQKACDNVEAVVLQQGIAIINEVKVQKALAVMDTMLESAGFNRGEKMMVLTLLGHVYAESIVEHLEPKIITSVQ